MIALLALVGSLILTIIAARMATRGEPRMYGRCPCHRGERVRLGRTR